MISKDKLHIVATCSNIEVFLYKRTFIGDKVILVGLLLWGWGSSLYAHLTRPRFASHRWKAQLRCLLFLKVLASRLQSRTYLRSSEIFWPVDTWSAMEVNYCNFNWLTVEWLCSSEYPQRKTCNFSKQKSIVI